MSCSELVEHLESEFLKARAAYDKARDAYRQDPTAANENAKLDAFRARHTAENQWRDEMARCQHLQGPTEQRERRKLEKECHAYRTEREALDSGLFGSLDVPEVMRWAKSDFLHELGAMITHATEHPGGKQVACDCITESFRWLRAAEHKKLRSNLRQKKALDDTVVWFMKNCPGAPPQ